MLGVGKMVIDKWQVLMSQPGKIHDLTIIRIGHLDHFLGTELRQGDLFDSDHFSPVEVLRFIDRRKPTLTDLTENTVAVGE
jgi:hypothetical protein